MDWFRGISHHIIQNLSNRSLAPRHTRDEDTDAYVLAQVTYIFLTNPVYYYFISILYIFTVANSSCQRDFHTRTPIGAIWTSLLGPYIRHCVSGWCTWWRWDWPVRDIYNDRLDSEVGTSERAYK